MPLPGAPGQAQSMLHDHPPVQRVALVTVGLVAELTGDSQGGKVVLKRAGQGFVGAQAGEGQVEYGGSHFGADSLTLVAATEP